MDKQELYKILDERGVEYDKRWSVDKLQALVGEDSQGEPAILEVPTPLKSTKLKVMATFKTCTRDGDRITHKYIGEGETAEEALKDMKCEDPEESEGQPWPDGCNCLVNVKVKRGDYEHSRALAPHVAVDVLQNKNFKLLKKLLGV